MTAKQENKLSMYLAVKAVCDRNTATWQTLQAFADGYTEFGLHVTNIQSLAQSQSQQTGGLATDKKSLREQMAEAAVEVASATSAYAKKTKNKDLAAKVNYSRSDMTGGRDTAAADIARNIRTNANANVANLAAYGVTAAKLTALQQKIDAYDASLAKPRDARAAGKTATDQMDAEFSAADAVLKDEMDNLAPQFKTANATFVKDYTNARIIVDSGGAKAKTKTPTPPPA